MPTAIRERIRESMEKRSPGALDGTPVTRKPPDGRIAGTVTPDDAPRRPQRAPPPRAAATPARVPERAPSVARALRDAASGALALRFPARWLEEHAVLPLAIVDGVAQRRRRGHDRAARR